MNSPAECAFRLPHCLFSFLGVLCIPSPKWIYEKKTMENTQSGSSGCLFWTSGEPLGYRLMCFSLSSSCSMPSPPSGFFFNVWFPHNLTLRSGAWWRMTLLRLTVTFPSHLSLSLVHLRSFYRQLSLSQRLKSTIWRDSSTGKSSGIKKKIWDDWEWVEEREEKGAQRVCVRSLFDVPSIFQTP